MNHRLDLAPIHRCLGAGAAIAGLALGLPGVAGAATPSTSAKAVNWNATLIAADAQRGRLVTAGRGGEVRTIVTTERAASKVRLGQRLKLRVRPAADGTYDATRVRATGKAKRTRVRGAVVERTAGQSLISAGGSVFAVEARKASKAGRASAGPVSAGDVVVGDLRIAGGRLVEQRMRDVGDTAALELEGRFVSLRDGVLEIAVDDDRRVRIAVPQDLSISAPAAGDEVEALVSVAADGGFTLIAFDADGESGLEFDYEDGEAEVEGTISALDAASVTVAGDGGAELSCAIPAGDVLTGFTIGDQAEMACSLGQGGFVLQELETEDAEYEAEEIEEEEDEDEDD